jgi:hypothetical protein
LREAWILLVMSRASPLESSSGLSLISNTRDTELSAI